VAGDEEAKDGEIELVADADGVAVIGDPTAVERFLRSNGLWAVSREVDLGRLQHLLRLGSEVVQGASEFVSNSGRWLKLTEESAARLKERGLMDTKTPGVKHIMLGTPGNIGGWLQSEQGLGAALSNPAMLSGLAGLMAQLATQQATAEITGYLAKIDVKVDDVLRKQDDDAIARMFGAASVIEDAMAVRDTAGYVSEVTWGKVEGTAETIGHTQGYALLQLRALADKLERTTKVAGLASAVEQAVTEVPEWLAVLARCSELQGCLDVLELDRVLAVSSDELNQHRLGLQAARQRRLDRIAEYTERLLDRIDSACSTANAKLLWNWTNARAVLESGNRVAADVHDLQQLLGIVSPPRGWEARRLEPAAEMGAQAIQKSKDAAPSALTLAALAGAALLKHRSSHGNDTDD
jgi:hypothetical protein